MNEKTEWTKKDNSKQLHSSGSAAAADKKTDYMENGMFKACLAVAAGLIVAALAKGVKDSDYFE